MTDPSPGRGPADDDGPPSELHRQRGVRAMVLGSLLAVLAPLAGFLGGSMVGDAGSTVGLSPLFLWMFIGLLVGGAGGVVAILGALRWARTRHEEDTAAARADDTHGPGRRDARTEGTRSPR